MRLEINSKTKRERERERGTSNSGEQQQKMQLRNKFLIEIPKLVGHKMDKERTYLYLKIYIGREKRNLFTKTDGMRKMKGWGI